ncbi:MAG: carboxypeptidase-like regulatory domain-containing protein [Pyrobaculum sp.]
MASGSVLRWYVSRLFGTRVFGSMSAASQTLMVCDDVLCFPVRFSESFRWWNPSIGNIGNRMFDINEAWDHERETEPSLGYPYDGSVIIIPGRHGYFIAVDLTDGRDRTVVHIARSGNNILIVNMGYKIAKERYTSNVQIKVYFPPESLGFRHETNGAAAQDGVILPAGKYVQFYRGSLKPVNIERGLFRESPIGSIKVFANELVVSAFRYGTIDIPSFYTGIKTNAHTENMYRPAAAFGGSSGWNNVNVSGVYGCVPAVRIADLDPYVNAGNWANFPCFTMYTGWAEEGESVKFVLFSTIAYKHNSRHEIVADVSATLLYDLAEREMYLLGAIKPLTNTYSKRSEAVGVFPRLDYPGRIEFREVPAGYIVVKSNDTYERLGNDSYERSGYGFCAQYSTGYICHQYLALYTNDVNISITNPKDMYIGIVKDRNIYCGVRYYGDRTLVAGKTYFVAARVWHEPLGLPDDEYAARVRKYTPKVLSTAEWSRRYMTLPPYVLDVGGVPKTAQVLSYSYSRSIRYGDYVTISGSVRGHDGTPHANKTVDVLLLKEGAIKAEATAKTDADGNFTVTLKPPEIGDYRVVIIVKNE